MCIRDSCGISGQRAKSRMDIHRPLRYMVVQTAADVNIKRAVCTTIYLKGLCISILLFALCPEMPQFTSVIDVYKRQVLDDLNYQFMRRLQKEGLVTLKELFIDGTKIEANANRYTFVSVSYTHLDVYKRQGDRYHHGSQYRYQYHRMDLMSFLY